MAATTWNPADASANISLSGGNLIASATTTTNCGVRSTTSKALGKVYFEITAGSVAGSNYGMAIADATFNFNTTIAGNDAHSATYITGGALVGNSGATFFAASTFTTGDVIGVAIDVPNHLAYWSKNGVWQNSADPAAGTGGLDYITTSAIFAMFFTNGASTSCTANFGASAFSNSPPSGFSPWDASTSSFPPDDGFDYGPRRRRNVRRIPI